MDVNKLKEYYNMVDKCSITIKKEVDIEYVITQISKMAFYVEDLNKILGELLIEQTRLEHILTSLKFEHELKVMNYLTNNSEVKKLSTSKERRDYVNYFLMKEEYREIVNTELELNDVSKLIDLTKKKARDLDKSYPKLKVIWDAVQSELKNLRKIGSDEEFISKVKDSIREDHSNFKPIFSDSLVEELTDDSYHKSVDISEKKDDQNNTNEDIISSTDTDILDEENDLLSDREINDEVEQLLADL